MIPKKNVDWEAVKNDYISDTESSFRSLSEKYGVAASAIHRRAKEGKWADKREQFVKKLESKTLKKLMEERAKKEVQRLEELYKASDKLIKKVSKAIDKVDPKNTLAIRQLTSSLKEMLSIEGVTPPDRAETTLDQSGGVVLISEIAPPLIPPEDESEPHESEGTDE